MQEVPSSLKWLLSMIMYGPKITSEIYNTQPCNTIAQLIVFNSKKQDKHMSSTSTFFNERHCKNQETTVPLYVGLKIHAMTHSKTLITNFEKLGLSISYSRVLEMDKLISLNQCEQFKNENIVCPSILRRNILTIGALDNIDHNPSSTMAKGSLHGTAISITQHPTEANPGTERPIKFNSQLKSDAITQPDDYSIVPAIHSKLTSVEIPLINRHCKERKEQLEISVHEEQDWCSKSFSQTTDSPIAWAAFHAQKQPISSTPTSITGLFPLFMEKADTPAMVKHGLDILIKMTKYLNPEQLSIMACD